jgi:hypothetical protein
MDSSGAVPEVTPPTRDPTIMARLSAQLTTVAENGRRGATLTAIDTSVVSKAEFEAKFRSSPQVLRGITTDWAAQAHWSSSAALLTRWGERTKFRVGDDESNEPVLMRLDDYVRYLPR